jgi:hypothetical protein
MRYNGVYSASGASDAYSAIGCIMELQVPTNTVIEILRMWVGAAEGGEPVADVQEISVYFNDAAATAGTGLAENEIQGTADAASGVTSLGVAPTIGATPTNVLYDGFHLQNGWLYLPVPEERFVCVGGSSQDNIGMQFPVAPDVSITISYGMIWGEIA